MRTRPERLSGIDHQVERLGSGRLPGRADPEPVLEHQRVVELPPATVPVLRESPRRDVDQRPARRGLQVGERGKLAGGAVHGVLDRAVAGLGLLDSSRRQLQQLGQHQLRVLGVDADGEAQEAQRPLPAEGAPELREHALVGPQVVIGHRVRELLVHVALLGVQMPGDDHVDDHPQASPARRAQ